MKRMQSHLVGVDQGEVVLFSDFADDGEMWSGDGPRVRRHEVSFSEPYHVPPSVTVSMSMFDMSSSTNQRADIQAENITTSGFEIVFRTWEDTKIARVRAAWQSIGELPNDDTWDI
ncbi:H-type lectin domain-containing protein [Yoonia sp. 208BN28-4]|uniref:H-type lectin domain-containing protein n=1 Tax=Yoonia sp. 208BN28-4 TaxID=3126505 RepID=UPI00309AF61B